MISIARAGVAEFEETGVIPLFEADGRIDAGPDCGTNVLTFDEPVAFEVGPLGEIAPVDTPVPLE